MIIKAFAPLKVRAVDDVFTEFTKEDRINFDKTVLSCFGFNTDSLGSLYAIFLASVRNRINLKDN